MSRPNVLLTGATGFVGSRILIALLEAKYNVRCVVRSRSKADELLAVPAVQNFAPEQSLSFAIVPNFSARDSFDHAFHEISYAIHVASPVPGPGKTDWEKDFIEPALHGTSEVLLAAQKTPTVKRIVFTSSVAGVIPDHVLAFGDESNKSWTADDPIPIDRGPYQNVRQAYNASKAMALELAARFVKTEKPKFDVIRILPGWVIGRNILAKDPAGTVSGSNWVAFGSVFGQKSTLTTPAIVSHADDVARAHAVALDPKIQGHQNLAVCFNADWSQSLEIVKKNFPQAVKDKIFPLNGYQPNVRVNFDSSGSEEILGFKFLGFEEQIVSVASHYLEELAKPGAKPVDPNTPLI